MTDQTTQLTASPTDDYGEPPISPPGFFKLLLDVLSNDDVRLQYIAMADRASLVSAGAGNQEVIEFLKTHGLEHFVNGETEPRRTHLLEALRVMGIRFRRLARDEKKWSAFLYLFEGYAENGDDEYMAW